jgi:hypothetical protein
LARTEKQEIEIEANRKLMQAIRRRRDPGGFEGRLFSDRGFSDRTVKALVARGIDAPERLLFASEAELRKIPGIGKSSFDEIMRYRARFLERYVLA